MIPVGKINEINRYPVKSFAGESLTRCEIMSYGLYGDRFCAFYDETKEGWDSYFTARELPAMLAYKVRLADDEVYVTSPDGRAFGWNEELLNEIQRFSNKKISMKECGASNPENPALKAVDQSSILIITDSTIRNLEEIWGKRLDPRRFRANIVVSLNEGTYNENHWIGKRLYVGSAELQVDMFCERCSMITFHPDTLERDATLLKKVYEELDLNFGVYASVVKTGQIQVGDGVFLKY